MRLGLFEFAFRKLSIMILILSKRWMEGEVTMSTHHSPIIYESNVNKILVVRNTYRWLMCRAALAKTTTVDTSTTIRSGESG